jgi:hypothetical protein
MVRGTRVRTVSLPAYPVEGKQASTAAPPLPWWRGWGPFLFLPAVVLLTIPRTWPRWALMWSLAFALYCGCKWLSWRRTPASGAPLWRHAAYLLAWPGLDARAFLDSRAAPPKPATREWLSAACKLLVGIALLFGVARWIPARLPTWSAGWAWWASP